MSVAENISFKSLLEQGFSSVKKIRDKAILRVSLIKKSLLMGSSDALINYQLKSIYPDKNRSANYWVMPLQQGCSSKT